MAHFNLNKITLGGRLTVTPELRQTQSGTMVTSVGLAVNRRPGSDGQTVTDFFNLVAWRGTAEFISKYFRKGSSICVTGSVQIRNWTDNNGAKRTSVDVHVDEAYFVDSKSETEAPTDAPAEAPNFTELPPDEDIPF